MRYQKRKYPLYEIFFSVLFWVGAYFFIYSDKENFGEITILYLLSISCLIISVPSFLFVLIRLYLLYRNKLTGLRVLIKTRFAALVLLFLCVVWIFMISSDRFSIDTYVDAKTRGLLTSVIVILAYITYVISILFDLFYQCTPKEYFLTDELHEN